MSGQLRKLFAKLTKLPSALPVLLGNGNIAKGWRAKQGMCTKQRREMLGFVFTPEMARREQSLEPHQERSKMCFNTKIKQSVATERLVSLPVLTSSSK